MINGEHKKSLAIVINTSWNVYNFRMGALKAFQDEGYRIIVIAPEDNYSQKLIKLGFEYYNIDINNKGTNPLEDTKLIVTFYRLYRQLKPDILLHYTIKPNIYGTIAARFAGVPVISNISGLGTVFLNNKLSSKVARLLYKFALRIPDKVFYQNKYDRDLFINAKLVSARKTGLLPGSGIDTERYLPAVKDNSGSSLRLLFIARLVKDKGLVEYVDAARMLKSRFPDVDFAILGAYYPGNPTAISEDEMVSWIDEGIVSYLGTSDDVQSVIAKADCIVLPSYREGLSRVLLEAASMAKPIVTTNVPGCKNVVDDGVNGFLCEVRDANSLAEKIEKMIVLSHSERTEMGLKGREKVVNEFDEKLVIDKYRKAISEILS